jgi:transcriptional antiterminator NusG
MNMRKRQKSRLVPRNKSEQGGSCRSNSSKIDRPKNAKKLKKGLVFCRKPCYNIGYGVVCWRFVSEPANTLCATKGRKFCTVFRPGGLLLSDIAPEAYDRSRGRANGEAIPKERIMDFQHWYAIFVMTGQEDSIRRRLENKLTDSESVKARFFVPKRKLKERKDGVVIEVCRVMFPGYVLVGTEQIDEVFDFVNNIKGVLRFLKNNDEFQEVHLEEISRLIYMTDDEGVIGDSKVWLNENDRVEVLSGPLKGFDGWITKLNRRKNRVAVSVLFGTERHEVWLGAEFIERSVVDPVVAALVGIATNNE